MFERGQRAKADDRRVRPRRREEWLSSIREFPTENEGLRCVAESLRYSVVMSTRRRTVVAVRQTTSTCFETRAW